MRVTTALLFALVSISHARAQSRNSVRLGPVTELRKGVDTWPLIIHPKNHVERVFDATLARLNKDLRKTVRDCDADAAEFDAGTNTSNSWSRGVRVTMSGPRFLSMIARDDFYCGGAHPDDNLTVIVFDLQTGKIVNWESFIAKAAGAISEKEVLGYDDATTPPFEFAGLQALYINAEQDECKDIFVEQQSFLLWPDAKDGALIAQVAGLGHAGAPCKVDFKLTLDQARKLGFDKSLLLAIQQAHRKTSLELH